MRRKGDILNANSYLCRLISLKKDWREILSEKKISVKEDVNGYAIFNYGIEADFSDPVVREARGIIIDLATLSVVCWPFTKFCNVQEPWHDDIDWESAVVEQKVDGSIVKHWWSEKLGKWMWSTNSVIDAGEAKAPSGAKFMNLIMKCSDYPCIEDDALDKRKTYIFELTSPENKVIIEYEGYTLWLLSVRDNVTGYENMEYTIDGVMRPARYPLRTLDECLSAAIRLNKNVSGAVRYEGFVVVDKDYHRVKIKSPEYVAKHHVVTNCDLSKRRVLDILFSHPEVEKDVEDAVPESRVYFAYYRYKAEEVRASLVKCCSFAKDLYEEYGHDRQAVYREIRKNPYLKEAMKFLSSDMNAWDYADSVFSSYQAAYQKPYCFDRIPDYIAPQY